MAICKIDDIGLSSCDFIKIDVEGGELGVLQGAVNTLSRDRPIVVFEVNVFCLWRYGRTLPQDLLSWVRDRYPHTAVIDSDAMVTHVESDATVNHVLHLLGSGPGVVDVVASHNSIRFDGNDLKINL